MRTGCRWLFVVSILFGASAVWAAQEKPLLAASPTMSETQIVFSYGGYLWSVPRSGGEARQLTTGGHESHAVFSPDGRWIAFTGQYDGNADVYVMPADRGVPRRLTWHPGPDLTIGFTPDGKKVLFRSGREAYADFHRLYTLPIEGGIAEVLPMWRAESGSYSPDAGRMAYVPNMQWQEAWKRYRGGQTTPIHVIRLDDLAFDEVPRDNSNDTNPVWLGGTVYFLSDRNGANTLFAYDTNTKTVKQVIENQGLDLKSIAAGPDEIVYEQFGGIHVFDPRTAKTRQVDIRIAADLPATRAHWENVSDKIQTAGISPTGARAVFEARGEILTVPAEKGDIRNLTRSVAVAERDPAWSPDGKWIAFFSDESGEYALHLVDQTGLKDVKKIDLGSPPSFFYSPIWSPDSKKIAFSDKRLNLWFLEIDKGAPVKVTTDLFDAWGVDFRSSWSPDSKWIAFSRFLPNHLRALFLYSTESKEITQLTDSMSDARYPVFDKGGKYLFFAASTDVGLGLTWLDLSGFQRPVSRSIYAMVLKKTDPNPVEPESDDEKAVDEKGKDTDKAKDKDKDKDKGKDKAKGKGQDGDKSKDEDEDENEKEEPPTVTVDFAGIGQRIVALPVKAANYVGLDAGKAGTLYLAEIPSIPALDGSTLLTVSTFDLAKRKTEPFLGEVSAFALSANGEKVLYRQGPPPGGGWFLAETSAAPKPGEGQLKLDAMESYVDPRAEWSQMYHEVWRIQRDFFYAPNFHGLDLAAAERKYLPYLEGAGGRGDINHLFSEMLGELTVGHMFVGGGNLPKASAVKGGLLGADYDVKNERYRFARIFNGENWNPELRAPLTQPGVDVRVGDYLLEVNGREVRPPQSVYSFFENTAGKQTKIKVGPHPDGKDAREVTVVPLESEFDLRNRAWQEDNRRKVDDLSGGKLAYVHVPDTGGDGFVNFNRFYPSVA